MQDRGILSSRVLLTYTNARVLKKDICIGSTKVCLQPWKPHLYFCIGIGCIHGKKRVDTIPTIQSKPVIIAPHGDVEAGCHIDLAKALKYYLRQNIKVNKTVEAITRPVVTIEDPKDDISRVHVLPLDHSSSPHNLPP
jgi:hypothetical protein